MIKAFNSKYPISTNPNTGDVDQPVTSVESHKFLREEYVRKQRLEWMDANSGEASDALVVKWWEEAEERHPKDAE
jgi:hypothetical protein